MKLNQISVTILIVVLALAYLETASAQSSNSSDADWTTFKSRFRKRYTNSSEEARRKRNYARNARIVAELNAASSSFKVGLNEFSDESPEDLARKLTGLKMTFTGKEAVEAPSNWVNPMKLTVSSSVRAATPSAYTYQGTGYDTSVRNQGSCGSCWAFVASASMQTQIYRVSSQTIIPSVEQMIDCTLTGTYTNYGCNGGSPETTYLYMISGIMTESDYPYTYLNSATQSGNCLAQSSKYAVKTFINSTYMYGTYVYGYYTDSTRTVLDYGAFQMIRDGGTGDANSTTSDVIIKILLAYGPIGVKVCAANTAFYNYKSGIYTNTACTDSLIDHTVMLVGYNSTGQYWILKNQWGTSWGISGYMYMKMGASLLRYPSFPVINVNSLANVSSTTAATTAKTTTASAGTGTTKTSTSTVATTSTAASNSSCVDISASFCSTMQRVYNACNSSQYDAQFRVNQCPLTCGTCSTTSTTISTSTTTKATSASTTKSTIRTTTSKSTTKSTTKSSKTTTKTTVSTTKSTTRSTTTKASTVPASSSCKDISTSYCATMQLYYSACTSSQYGPQFKLTQCPVTCDTCSSGK